MSVPAVTVGGPVFVTARSAAVSTVALVVELSSPGVGSLSLKTVAEFEIVSPDGALEFTCTTRINVSVSPAATGWFASARIGPVPPGAGVANVNVVGPLDEMETKVVSGGTESVTNTPLASLGPELLRESV